MLGLSTRFSHADAASCESLGTHVVMTAHVQQPKVVNSKKVCFCLDHTPIAGIYQYKQAQLWANHIQTSQMQITSWRSRHCCGSSSGLHIYIMLDIPVGVTIACVCTIWML